MALPKCGTILTNVVCVAVVIPLTLIIESNLSSASRCSTEMVRLAEFAGDTLKTGLMTIIIRWLVNGSESWPMC